tara:strand:- start:1286 stop:1717 length:432 start_codon:yes stop_codon:yes gene_type:complete
MLKLIKKLFKKTPENIDLTSDINIACAILLIEVSYADFKIDTIEIKSIVKLIEKEFNLDKEKAKWVTAEAQELHKDINCLRKYIKLINDKFTNSQKNTVINMAWQIAKADNIIDKHEEHRIRKISELLHLDHTDFIKAKIKTK